MKNTTRNIFWMVLLITMTLVVCNAASACPMCKESIMTARNDLQRVGKGSLSGGFTYSIYLMLLGLFATLGMVSFNLMRAVRPPKKK